MIDHHPKLGWFALAYGITENKDVKTSEKVASKHVCARIYSRKGRKGREGEGVLMPPEEVRNY